MASRDAPVASALPRRCTMSPELAFPGTPASPVSGPRPPAQGHSLTPAGELGSALTSPRVCAVENVPRFPIARRAGLHLEQQNLRDHPEPADSGGGHGVGQRGRGAPGHHHEGQR